MRSPRWIELHVFPVLRSLIPRWLVFQSMIKASEYIRYAEEVPAVPFTVILERVAKDDRESR